jgi:glucan phosphoethanolaminetransferase (alkaline phosphatase superfamily)
MMMYFILGLIACLGLVSALFVLLIVFLRKNWNHACKSRLSFLAPILLVAVISYLSL